jgi:Sulfotransferase family
MIIFTHVHKTAGTSFRFILENSFGFSHCHTNHTKKPFFTQADLDFAKKLFPRLRSIAGHNLVDALRFSEANPFHMTILREPIARVISNYQASYNWGKNQTTFEESLRTGGEYQNWHVQMMAGSQDLDKAKRFLEKCDFVGLTEKFDLSLHVLQKLCPYKLNLNYRRKVVAADNSIKKSILDDHRLMDMAREYNKLDIALYDFAVAEIFPRLCAKAGFSPTDKVPTFDTYQSELKIKFLLSRFYNMSIYRQICKLRS